jgi:hypothetical protein
MTWHRLHPALPLDAARVTNLLRAVATMRPARRVVLETYGTGHLVGWRVGADEATAHRLSHSLSVHAPGSRLVQLSEQRRPVRSAAQLAIRGHRQRTLAVDRTEEAARAVLGALSLAQGHEELRLQIILGNRLHPLAARSGPKRTGDGERRRQLVAKTGHHGFGCVVRIGACAATTPRARQLIGSLLAALITLEAPGIRVGLRRASPSALDRASAPWLWPLSLSVTELTALIGWPIGQLPLPGVSARHPRPMAAAASVPRKGRVLGDSLLSGDERPVAISVEDSLHHLHVLGPTGTGKSTLLANLAVQDMAAGRGLVVIDPKGDLVRDLLERIPPARADEVVVLDPTDVAPVGINPLQSRTPDLAADGVLSVFADLYAASWGPRTQDILHACLLSLARRGDASLVLVPLLLTNPGFRRSVVGRVAKHDPMGLGSFWAWYDAASDAERQTAIAPLMNKLRPILLRPGLRAALGQLEPRFDLADVFTKRRILLVSLAKGQLGAEAARLLGSLVVSLLWQAGTRRTAVPLTQRAPVMIVIDEVQDYLRLPGDLGDCLTQARGLGVGFTLTHQHLGQLPAHLKAAMLANARSRVCFQLPHDDALVIARGSDLQPDDFTALPAFAAYASVLCGGTPASFASIQTRPLPAKSSRAADIRERSRQCYGRPLSETEQSWSGLAGAAVEPDVLGRRPRGADS